MSEETLPEDDSEVEIEIELPDAETELLVEDVSIDGMCGVY